MLLKYFSSGVWDQFRRWQFHFRIFFTCGFDDNCCSLPKRWYKIVWHPSKLFQVLVLFEHIWSDVTLLTIFQFRIDVRTLSPISSRVQNASSIDKGHVCLEEELKGVWLSLTVHLWPALQLGMPGKLISRLKDFHLLLSAETLFVSLVEMTIWSSLYPKTTTSTSGICLRVKGTTIQSTNHYSSCVATQVKSTPSGTTPVKMCSPLLVKRKSSNCGYRLHSGSSDTPVYSFINLIQLFIGFDDCSSHSFCNTTSWCSIVE